MALLSQPTWPSFFSYQEKIDPNTITDYYDSLAQTGYFNNQLVFVPRLNQQILGESASLANPDTTKRIEVDLTNQKLYAYENNNLVFEYTISSGTWNRTPTGTFTVWAKIRSQKMSGGSKELGTYYYLPNVPYILFYYNDKVAKKVGYSIHGAYWHNNFGTPMSHGCINMRISEAGQIYSFADIGTQITVFGKYKPKLSLK